MKFEQIVAQVIVVISTSTKMETKIRENIIVLSDFNHTTDQEPPRVRVVI